MANATPREVSHSAGFNGAVQNIPLKKGVTTTGTVSKMPSAKEISRYLFEKMRPFKTLFFCERKLKAWKSCIKHKLTNAIVMETS